MNRRSFINLLPFLAFAPKLLTKLKGWRWRESFTHTRHVEMEGWKSFGYTMGVDTAAPNSEQTVMVIERWVKLPDGTELVTREVEEMPPQRLYWSKCPFGVVDLGGEGSVMSALEPLNLSPIARANLLPYFHLQQDWARDEKEKAYWESVVGRVEEESER